MTTAPSIPRIDNGIAEMILDHPPVNAFDSAGWFAIAERSTPWGKMRRCA